MRSFPDTSFLCSLYRTQDNSSRADRIFNALKAPLAVSSLLLLEFRQSARYQVGLYRRDKPKGFSRGESEEMLRDLKKDLDTSVLEIVPVEWLAVHHIAERISEKHTASGCHRLTDILHVATALYLEVDEFLTFDSNQKKLAQAEGLEVVL